MKIQNFLFFRYMVTSAADRGLRIWDVRQLKGPVQNMQLRSVATHLQLSQRGCLGVGMGNIVEVFIIFTLLFQNLL